MVILLTAVPGKKCRWFLHCKNQTPNTEEKMTDHILNLITLVVIEVSVSLPLGWCQKWLLWTRTYADNLLVLGGLTTKVLTGSTWFGILAEREVWVITVQLLGAISITLIFKAKPSLTLAVMSRDVRVGFANLLILQEQGNASGFGAGLGHSLFLSDTGFWWTQWLPLRLWSLWTSKLLSLDFPSNVAPAGKAELST